jgi:hypothetical protein
MDNVQKRNICTNDHRHKLLDLIIICVGNILVFFYLMKYNERLHYTSLLYALY